MQILHLKTEIRVIIKTKVAGCSSSDDFIEFSRLQGRSWLSSTSPPWMTSPPSSPTQSTCCTPTFSKHFHPQDSRDLASTRPAFILRLRWSSPRGLQVTTKEHNNTRTVRTTITAISFPHILLFPLSSSSSTFSMISTHFFPQAPRSSSFSSLCYRSSWALGWYDTVNIMWMMAATIVFAFPPECQSFFQVSVVRLHPILWFHQSGNVDCWFQFSDVLMFMLMMEMQMTMLVVCNFTATALWRLWCWCWCCCCCCC